MNTRRKQAVILIGLAAFSLGSSIGDDSWWTWITIPGNMLMISYGWSELAAAEVDR